MVTVIHQFRQTDITLHRVGRRGDIDVAIGIPGTIISKRREFAVKLNGLGKVVNLGLEDDRLVEL